MNVSLGFQAGDGCHVRQLDLERDRPAVAALGSKCVEYLRQAAGCRFDARQAPRRFLEMLVPTRVPVARSFVLGIFRNPDATPPVLVGVLYFLHPETDPGTWYIPLLLLEPAARGRGIGSAVQGAFAEWARARGARRLTVAVAEDNPRARNFWCERMGFLENPAGTQPPTGGLARWKPEFVRSLDAAERVRLRVA